MTIAAIHGVALHAPDEPLAPEDLRERAWSELLRQEAVAQGLLADSRVLLAQPLTDAEQAVVERMVETEVPTRTPTAEEARRHHEAHRDRFVEGAQARVRHILFAVTDGVDVTALARRAEQALLELLHRAVAPGRFAELARELSNCPSGADGGELGWLAPWDVAPELAAELFHQPGAAQHRGLKTRLVHSRYGLHILDVQDRLPGRPLAFEEVRGRIEALLAQQHRARALHQYIRVLAGRAKVEGVELDAATSPLLSA